MATNIDIEVGKRLKRHRRLRKLSQTKVATAAGITFQQVQKYESGENRLTISRGVLLAGALRMPFEEFVKDLEYHV